MDFTGVVVPTVATGVAALGLWWHLLRARKGDVTPGNRVMGALWAAVFVVAGARVLWLVANPDSGSVSGEGREPAAPAETR